MSHVVGIVIVGSVVEGSMIIFPLAKGDPTMENLPTDLRKLAIERFPETISSRIAIVALGADVAGTGGNAVSRSGAKDA